MQEFNIRHIPGKITGGNRVLFYILGILLSFLAGYAFVTKGFFTAIIIMGLIGSIVLINNPFLVLCIFTSLVGFEALQAIRASDIYSITGIKIVGLILFLSVLPKIAIRPLKIPLGIELYSIGVFLLFIMASYINALNIASSLSGTLTFVQLIILWFAVRIVVDKQEKITVLAKIILCTVSVSAFIGVWQYFSDPGSRISGISQNAAILSSDLYVAFWFGVVLMFTSLKQISRIIWVGLVFIIILALLFSLLRAAYIAFLPSAFTAGIYYGKPGKVFVLMVIFMIIVAMLAPFTVERMKETSVEKDASTRGHLHSLDAGVQMMGDHPFLGVGIGNYSEHYLRYTNDPRRLPRTPHNSYLAIGSEIGIFGLIAYLLLHIVAFYKLWITAARYRLHNNRKWLIYTCGIAGALTSFCIIGLFHTLQISKFLWILLALGSILPTLEEQKSIHDF